MRLPGRSLRDSLAGDGAVVLDLRAFRSRGFFIAGLIPNTRGSGGLLVV